MKINFNLDFNKPRKGLKIVVCNFDDPLNCDSFLKRTKIGDDLQKAWKTKNNMEAYYKQWKHSLNSMLYEYFPKRELIFYKQVYNKEVRQHIKDRKKT